MLVLFGVAAAGEQQFLEQAGEHVVDPLAISEIETATIELTPGEEQVDARGNIRLRELTPERLLLTRLNARLEAEYELGDRARVVEHKLEVIGDAADAFLNIIQDRRSVRLELTIIALIAFKVIVGLVEKLI